MKQFKFIIFALCLFMATAIYAQMPQGRTSETIIADALALLPAETPELYNQLMADLISTGEEGLLDLIGRMNPPGEISNEFFEFAITGWIHSVANDNDKREVAVGAVEKALAQPIDKEIKAFLIRQIRTIAGDENVELLAGFLNDDHLSNPAAQALLTIGSDRSAEAILNSLKTKPSEEISINLINALGQTSYSEAESTLLSLLSNNPSENMEKVLLNALAQLGSKSSILPLRKAAESTNYSYNKKSATVAYLTLLNRLNDTESKLVNKEAKKLLSTSSKLNKQDLKTAATLMLLKQSSAKPANILRNVFKDGNIIYLAGLLNQYPFQSDEKSVDLITKELTLSRSPEIEVCLIDWVAKYQPERAIPLIANHTDSPVESVKKAATIALTKLSGDESLLALTEMLKNGDEESVELAKNALLRFDGDISNNLSSIFNDCSDIGKIAVLNIIANRKMENQYDLVYNQMLLDRSEVKSAAAKTVKDVVTRDNLSDLFGLLEYAEDEEYISDIQEGISASLSNYDYSEQIGIVIVLMENSSNRHRYYNLLADIGSDDAMNLIAESYNSEPGKNRDAAFEALTKMSSFNVIYSLLDIVRGSNNNVELEKVTDALIKLISNSDKTGAIKYLYLRETFQFAQNESQKNEILKLLGDTGYYQAMLFVAQFMDNPALKESAALAVMNIALSNSDFAGEATTKILNRAAETLSNPDADYQRQSINKYLSENPIDGGFISIFNGENLDGWKGLVMNPIKRAEMTKKQLAAAQTEADKEAAESWIVENGELIFTGKGQNLCTEKQYANFEMLVDWKLYPGPEPDGGIYLRGSPQVQIWDTSRVNVGAEVGSGGLYNNKLYPDKPLRVADQKVGEWNSFRIKMIGERVYVWLNGELVTDNVVLENYWDREQPIFPIEQIELQAHGSKMAYRDIYIKEIPQPDPFKLSPEEEAEGFHILFDGTNLDQWVGNKGEYIVENGTITVYPNKLTRGSTRNLYTAEQFDNFVFRFEFMLTEAANNGLGIRAPLEGDAAYLGMELQILDNESPRYEKLKKYQYHGSVYGVIPAKRGFLKPVGEWNYQEVIADGDNIKVILNGTTILDGNIREASKDGTIDNKEHPGLLNESGHIGFLGHGSTVKFKNIRIKELK